MPGGVGGRSRKASSYPDPVFQGRVKRERKKIRVASATIELDSLRISITVKIISSALTQSSLTRRK